MTFDHRVVAVYTRDELAEVLRLAMHSDAPRAVVSRLRLTFEVLQGLLWGAGDTSKLGEATADAEVALEAWRTWFGLQCARRTIPTRLRQRL